MFDHCLLSVAFLVIILIEEPNFSKCMAVGMKRALVWNGMQLKISVKKSFKLAKKTLVTQ